MRSTARYSSLFLRDCMKNIFITIIILLGFCLSSNVAKANEVTQSAQLKDEAGTLHGYTKISDISQREITLSLFLENKKSPIAGESGTFVKSADKYGLDWRMVAAISGVESSFGKRIPYNSYNAYGWNNGDYKFKSWDDSIDHVTMTLRKKYVDKGKVSVSKIARTYAPPSSTWGNNVKFFMRKIDSIPLEFDL